jgi:Transposase
MTWIPRKRNRIFSISGRGAVEAINGIIQPAKRRAHGLRNFCCLRTVVYWVAAKLIVRLPSLLPILKQRGGEIVN